MKRDAILNEGRNGSEVVFAKWLTIFLREILARCKSPSLGDLTINLRFFCKLSPRVMWLSGGKKFDDGY